MSELVYYIIKIRDKERPKMTLAEKEEMEGLYTIYSDRIEIGRGNPDRNRAIMLGLEKAVSILGYRFECVYKEFKGTEFRTYRLVREQ